MASCPLLHMRKLRDRLAIEIVLSVEI